MKTRYNIKFSWRTMFGMKTLKLALEKQTKVTVPSPPYSTRLPGELKPLRVGKNPTGRTTSPEQKFKTNVWGGRHAAEKEISQTGECENMKKGQINEGFRQILARPDKMCFTFVGFSPSLFRLFFPRTSRQDHLSTLFVGNKKRSK